ncbi:MAG: preprotein translocase subunit SecA [Gemmatimonadota bacterium]|nr:MAG: preprotein translocase subunit SecA [Gemmatimonadota bacterium]
MIKQIVTDFLGTKFERDVRKIQPIVDEIHRHEEILEDFSEEQLKAQTEKFRGIIHERVHEIEDEIVALRETKKRTEEASERERMALRIGQLERELHEVTQDVLNELLPEAYATVREACRRLLGQGIVVRGHDTLWDMVPYDVQLIGGIVLHQGKIAEMATGEGKTLVATMPLYLNALSGKGAHLVTVNDYLARRDSEWMGTVFEYLGLTVGCIDSTEPGSAERHAVYECDITYGTNNEFGFDYLRDNMVHRLEDRVQRTHNYAIIDEVDSVLIDEARTPLIISGPVGREDNKRYAEFNTQVASLARKQARIVNSLLAEAEDLLKRSEGEEGDPEASYSLGEKVLLAHRGNPTNKKLAKLLQEPGVRKIMQRVEADYMREKRLHELEEDLLYSMDEKGHQVHLTDQGLDALSPKDHEAFVVPDLSQVFHEIEKDESLSTDEQRQKIAKCEQEYAQKSEKIHIIHQLLKAYTLFEKDTDYVVEGGQVIIVDEFTGRKMAGRRWSDGLHQAVEAKEAVTVRGETQTLATITIQNYFRMYEKLAGMTGTAETEEGEFHEIYGLEVVVIPTNRPVRRIDQDDVVFKTKREKYSSLLDEIERMHSRGLPILVGTTSVDTSETVSRMLRRRGIKHNVLNAKYHEREAEIVAHAGHTGAVTIATNMAGRGTDIKLAPGVVKCRVCAVDAQQPSFGRFREEADLGTPQAKEFGCSEDPPCGLVILGTERHDARRIDRQLRGRSGRQGDPGSSRFFLSLEDDLMRLFMAERLAKIMDKLGAEEGEVITHPWVTKAIERAQKRVEITNFEARKRLLEYDDVMNQQREVIYDLRVFALEGGEDLKGEVWDMIRHAVLSRFHEYVPDTEHEENWDLAGLKNRLLLEFFLHCPELPDENALDVALEWDGREAIADYVVEKALAAFRKKVDEFGDQAQRILSYVFLYTVDEKWKDHLYDLDQLKAGIYFRAWGQKDPLIEYKKEAYDMFVDLMGDIRTTLADRLFKAQVMPPRPMRAPQISRISGPTLDTTDEGYAPGAAAVAARQAFAPTGVAASAQAASVTGVSDPMGAPLGGPAPARQPATLLTNRAEGPAPSKPASPGEKVGRNDPCPCGSGKKYKKCHGRPGAPPL